MLSSEHRSPHHENSMFAKLLRSVVIGLIVAGLLLAALPMLRSSNGLFAENREYQRRNTGELQQGGAPRRARRGQHLQPQPERRRQRAVARLRRDHERTQLYHHQPPRDQRRPADHRGVAGRPPLRSAAGRLRRPDRFGGTEDRPRQPAGDPDQQNRVAHVGDVVLAIGNPYNPGRPSLRASSAPPGASV